MKKGITLIGMPGAGKSTVGEIVAGLLDYDFLDIDRWMVKFEGKPVPKIISEKGRSYILSLEAECVAFNSLYETVVSPPGSIVYTNSLPKLQDQTDIFYLQLPLEEIEKRLASDPHNERGVIGLGELGLRGLYEERTPLYQAWADVVVDCSGKSAGLIAHEVIDASRKLSSAI